MLNFRKIIEDAKGFIKSQIKPDPNMILDTQPVNEIDKINPFIQALNQSKRAPKLPTANIFEEIKENKEEILKPIKKITGKFKNKIIEVKNELPAETSDGFKKIPQMIGNHETKVKWLGGDRNDPKSYISFKDEEEKYSYTRPESGHLGKYQVSPDMLKTYSDDIFGKDIPPEEFLKSKELQDQFIDGIVERWQKEGMDKNEIIKRWNQGRNADLNNNLDADNYLKLVEEDNKEISEEQKKYDELKDKTSQAWDAFTTGELTKEDLGKSGTNLLYKRRALVQETEGWIDELKVADNDVKKKILRNKIIGNMEKLIATD